MTPTKSKQRSDGFILVVVLGVVLALSGLLFGFAQTTRTSLSKANGFYRTEQAWNGAWAGLQTAIAILRDVNDTSTDPQVAKLLTRESTFPVGDANCCLTITEENGLLNVNRLKSADGRIDRKQIDRLLGLIDILNRRDKDLPPIGYGIVPAIIDWIDSDDEVTTLTFIQRDSMGAESDYYQTCKPPRLCRNGPVDTLDELVWVKGMTPEAFGRLRPFLTCRGDGKIDINTAPKLVIQSLSEQMDATLAEMIVRQRDLQPFKSLSELQSIPGMAGGVYESIQGLITVNPTERFYRVQTRAGVQDHRCTLEALLQRDSRTGTVEIVQYREL